MRRRSVLYVMTTTIAAISGCASVEQTGSNTETNLPSRSSESSGQQLSLVLVNGSSEEVVVNFELLRQDTLREDTVTIGSGERVTFDSNIHEVGRYSVEIAVENGLEEAYSWNVEDYDLRMGSDMILSITENEIKKMVEE